MATVTIYYADFEEEHSFSIQYPRKTAVYTTAVYTYQRLDALGNWDTYKEYDDSSWSAPDFGLHNGDTDFEDYCNGICITQNLFTDDEQYETLIYTFTEEDCDTTFNGDKRRIERESTYGGFQVISENGQVVASFPTTHYLYDIYVFYS